MPKKRIHLVCNAHLDPVWLWHWEDGLAEALSTYRVAAEFCRRHRRFVFNHNEALLYNWVQQYEPRLFNRIKMLVRTGQWHISGGTYLQPDINSTSGESHIRQYLLGRGYFTETFGSYPKTAYNFDSFGHAEGFCQILAGCGMANYIFCRPDFGTYDLPVGAFRWQDRSGSEVVARRSDDHYLSREDFPRQLDRFLKHYGDEPETMILWGLGNHGGGPSRAQYTQLKSYIRNHREVEWIESTPDRFFADLLKHSGSLPVVRGEIQNSFPGCYTSMSRVKRAHREAESLMAATERLCALSWWWGAAAYPRKDLEVAWKDILFGEFHDILPGSGTPTVERDSLQLLAHANEILRRRRFKALHSLIRLEPRGAAGHVPVFVANPHGFPVRTQIEFELQLGHDPEALRNPKVKLRLDGRDHPCQRLKAEANVAEPWRVRLATMVKLDPWQVLRLEEHLINDRSEPQWRAPKVTARFLSFRSTKFHLRINPKTGLVDHLSLPGESRSLVGPGAFAPAYFADLDHSWTCGSPKRSPTRAVWSVPPAWDAAPAGRFRLAGRADAARLSPPPADKWTKATGTAARPLRIIEHGPLRTVVEAMFVCGSSGVVRQYHIGHSDGSLQICDRVFNNHRDHMLKLMVPLAFEVRDSISEALYSAVERPASRRHEDRTNQRWVAVRGRHGGKAVFLAVLNTASFAHSLTGRELALNVLRSPAYSSFNLDPENPRQSQRFVPRQDQGEHMLCFSLMIGRRFAETPVSRAAQLLNTPPFCQVYYPQAEKGDRRLRRRVAGTVLVDDAHVQVVALKKAEKGNDLIVRLQETAGRERQITVRIKPFRQPIRLTIGRYGLVTLAVRRGGSKLRWRRMNLVEQPVL